MAMRLMSRFAPHDENAAVNAKSAQKAAGGSIKSRPKLSNITNKIQHLPPATPTPLKPSLPTPIKPTPLKAPTATPKVRNVVPEQRKQPKQKQPRLKKVVDLPRELAIKTEAWAKEGIEKVHFTGDDMEQLREKLEQEEIENRVKAVLSFRTELFPTWTYPSPATNDPFDDEGKLKLDEFETKFQCERDDDELKSDADEGLDKLLQDTQADFSQFCFTPFQDDWFRVRDGL